MQVGYANLKQRSNAVAEVIASERSARNLASRRQRIAQADARAKARDQRDKKRRDDREADAARRKRIRVKVEQRDRPRYRGGTPRRLYHRHVDRMLKGTTGLSDSRGPDRLYAIHYAFVARGFGSRKVRRWRTGEAERAALYGVREDALEGGERGWWSNIADDRNELAAHYRASEALEKHDRANANVYISEVIALPAELTARQRRRAVRRICRWFETKGLPYTVGIHLPDQAGDQRNYHCHIVYSLRPCQRVAPYEWAFAPGKRADINTPDGIRARRLAVVRAINATLHAARIDKRYTHLSNRARNMAPPVEGKAGQQATWTRRRLAALQQRRVRLTALAAVIASLRQAVVEGGARVDTARRATVRRIAAIGRCVEVFGESDGVDDARIQVARAVDRARDAVVQNATAGESAIAHARYDVLGQVNRMRNDVASVGDSVVGTDATRIRDRLDHINRTVGERTRVGATRVAEASRRVEQGTVRDAISVAILAAITEGALRLAERRSLVSDRLDAMAAGTGAALPSFANAARAALLARLAGIHASIDTRSPVARQVTATLIALKRGTVGTAPDSPAMRAIRAHVPTRPDRDVGMERQPVAAVPPTPQVENSPPVKPPVDVLSIGSDHVLARAMAVERETLEREAAWKRLIKRMTPVTQDGERYSIDMAGLPDADRRLLIRPAFADELQRRLGTLFAHQTASAALPTTNAPEPGDDEADALVQRAFRDRGAERT